MASPFDLTYSYKIEGAEKGISCDRCEKEAVDNVYVNLDQPDGISVDMVGDFCKEHGGENAVDWLIKCRMEG